MLANKSKALKKKGKVRVEFQCSEQDWQDFKTTADRMGKSRWDGLRDGMKMFTKKYRNRV
jgi:hypothetical protein